MTDNAPAQNQPPAPDSDEVRDRLRRVFLFLKEQQEYRSPIRRNLDAYEWRLDLSSLPAHASVQRRPHVRENPLPLLEVSRPEIEAAPVPPSVLNGWVLDQWTFVNGSAVAMEHRAIANGASEPETQSFKDDTERVAAFEAWQAEWRTWHERALPAWQARELYDRLFELYAALQRDVGRVEAIVANANLTWNDAAAGSIDHPMLLRRVKVDFDSAVPKISVVDVVEAPNEFNAGLLVGDPAIENSALRRVQDAFREDSVHPLSDSVESWARPVAQTLWVDGRFEHKRPSSTERRPVFAPRPVLLMRSRGQALPGILGDVAEQIAAGSELPSSLRSIVGQQSEPREAAGDFSSSWAVTPPADVLFGKPANAEQLKLVRELDRHDAILVQGPPGTGKSHTIANLIGHLTAQGKTVLVTSQKGKALTVLREHLINELRPLAVSVIKEEGSEPLRAAASALLEGMAQTPSELEGKDRQLTDQRNELLANISKWTDEILHCVQSEYRVIRTGYNEYAPAEAARIVSETANLDGWLPGPLVPEATCPLEQQDLARLYRLTAELAQDEEAAVLAGVPDQAELPAVDQLSELISVERQFNFADVNWENWESGLADTVEALPAQQPACNEALDEIQQLKSDLDELDSWEEPVIDGALRADDGRGELQVALKCIADWRLALAVERKLRIEQHVDIRMEADQPALLEVVERLIEQVGTQGHISLFRRLFSNDLKRLSQFVSIGGKPPQVGRDFEAIRKVLVLGPERKRLAREWTEVMRNAPALSLDDGECVGLASRLEHRVSLVNKWRRLKKDLPARTGLRASTLERRGAPVIEALPVLMETRRLLASLDQCFTERLSALSSRQASLLLAAVENEMSGSTNSFVRECVRAVRNRDIDSFEKLLRVASHLRQIVPQVKERHSLLARLSKVAPGWAQVLRQRDPSHVSGTIPGDVETAWKFRQADQELTRRHEVKLERLQASFSEAQKQLLIITRQLIRVRTWRHLLADRLPRSRQDLFTYVALMRQYGKGTGLEAPKILQQARIHLERARGAVPVWIMPLDRVFDSFSPAAAIFDVVIVDEASQCDLTGLLAYYLGKKVVVVGDHEQVQPTVIGIDLSAIDRLRQTHLHDIPGSYLFRPDTSIYEFARTSFGGQLMLLEHFRCVPDIIAFSNQLSYGGAIRALRPESAAPAPHLVEHVVPRIAYNDIERTNRAEAVWIAAIVTAMSTHAAYDGRSIGVVSLLYDPQVKLLGSTLTRYVPTDAWLKHDLDFGSPSQFQGDERDVMLLSMVSKPANGPQRLLSERLFKSRFNVAASRARDQLWLVHSLDPAIDLKPGDYRLRLIEHVRDPAAARRLFEEKVGLTESPFEREVLQRLVESGYEVTPQFRVGYYRIDLVVWDGKRRLAIECDGERYHGLEELPNDLARQATLERLGWTFIRIRGSQWYKDKLAAWAWLEEQLSRHEIAPSRVDAPRPEVQLGATEREILASARDLLFQWGESALVPTIGDSTQAPTDRVLADSDELAEGEFVA